MQNDQQGTAAARYGSLEADRQVFLTRARVSSEITIPTLFPPQGHSGSTQYVTPYQSLGARGVNNLASKLLLALLPPESCFFRIKPDASVQMELDSNPQGQDDDSDKLDQALSDMEQKILAEINTRGVRVHAFEMFKQLIVGGNTLIFLPLDKGIRVFRLDQYVVQRDPSGNVTEIVVKECIAPNALPEPIKAQVLAAIKNEKLSSDPNNKDQALEGDKRTVDVFTWIRLESNQWKVCQEVRGMNIPESEGTYPLDKCPWLPLRWTRIDGESYGRGLCEEYIGDLSSLEALSKILVQAGMVAGKILIMVKPNGTTRPEALANKPNGAVVEGDPDDVKAFGLEKTADFTFISNLSQAIEQRLSFAFLLNSSIQRDGDRVTAEEIRYMAGELEDALGGVYSLLSDEFQRPLATIIMSQMEREKKLPSLPEGTVNTAIVTGLDALGRNHEGARLDQFVGAAMQTFGPQAVPYISISDWLSRKAASLGIRTKGLIRSEEEVQQQQAQQQQTEIASKLGGPAIQAGAKVATTQMQQAQTQQEPSTNA